MHHIDMHHKLETFFCQKKELVITLSLSIKASKDLDQQKEDCFLVSLFSLLQQFNYFWDIGTFRVPSALEARFRE